jgi:REP-associated tyrosine transposase
MLPHAVRRLRGCSYEGARTYFVTILTRQRRRHFARADVVELAAREVTRAATQTRFDLVIACYMPDHLHLVVEGRTSSANLLLFLKTAKQFSAFYVKRRFDLVLWARGYHDRIIREDEDVGRYVRYVWNNPVNARLVEHADAYPLLFVSSTWRARLHP